MMNENRCPLSTQGEVPISKKDAVFDLSHWAGGRGQFLCVKKLQIVVPLLPQTYTTATGNKNERIQKYTYKTLSASVHVPDLFLLSYLETINVHMCQALF